MTYPDETTRGKLLVVLMDGHRAATLVEGDGGRLQLTYDEEWRASATATPLSLSMPLTLVVAGAVQAGQAQQHLLGVLAQRRTGMADRARRTVQSREHVLHSDLAQGGSSTRTLSRARKCGSASISGAR